MSTAEFEIIPIDPYDKDLVDSLIDAKRAVQAHDIPDFAPPRPAVERLRLLLIADSIKVERWLAVADGQVLGYAQLDMPAKDNLHMVDLTLEVRPEHRRRGIGTRLLEHVERRAAELGRDTVISYAVESFEEVARLDESGKAFAAARGYPVVESEILRRNVLADVDEAELDRLYAEAWKKADGYELIEWTGEAPDDVAEGLAHLHARMWTDPPTGDMDIRPAVYDVARLRDEERVWIDRGVLRLGALVRDPGSGEVAGYTIILVFPGEEVEAVQGDTIVDPRHRGKRLGTVLKIANQRQLRRYRPMLRYVITWNSVANDHMIGINEAVGYRRYLRELIVQKKLA